MSYSFRIPQHLLHSLTEPQWLPRSKEVTEPRVTALERQEKKRREDLKARILPAAPEPIGIAGAPDQKNMPAPPAVDFTAHAPRPLFWEQYRDQVDQARAERKGKSSKDKPQFGSAGNEGVGGEPTSRPKRSRMSFDLASPTGRTG